MSGDGLFVAKVDEERCVDCGFCQSPMYCPSPQVCIGCGVCVQGCARWWCRRRLGTLRQGEVSAVGDDLGYLKEGFQPYDTGRSCRLQWRGLVT